MPQSEIRELMQRIDLEIRAANNALYGLSQGGSKHEFITARYDRLGQCHEELIGIVGPQEAIKMIGERFDQLLDQVDHEKE
jgi:hypothetical protein